MENLILLTVAALVCAAISFTITVTSIFQWLRERLGSYHEKLDQLLHCPWCLGHYVIAVFLLTSNLDLIPVSNQWIYNFLFTLFYMVCIGGLVHYVLLRAYEPVAKVAAIRKLEKMKAAKKAATE